MTFRDALQQEPKIKNLTSEQQLLYLWGFTVMSGMKDTFIDLPELPKDRFSELGLFYEIPYIHHDQLYSQGNSVNLLVVYEIENVNGNKSSFCPLRISFTLQSEHEYIIKVHDQRGPRPITKILLQYTYGKSTSDFRDMEQLTLSRLLTEGDKL